LIYYRGGFLLGTSPNAGGSAPTYSTGNNSVFTWSSVTVKPTLYILTLAVPNTMVSGKTFAKSLTFTFDTNPLAVFNQTILEVTLPPSIAYISHSTSPAATTLVRSSLYFSRYISLTIA